MICPHIVAALAFVPGTPAAPVRATVTVDARRVLGTWNARLLGGNILGYQKGSVYYTGPDASDRAYGFWSPERRAPEPAMVALAKRAGMRSARWPGGCNAHLFDWKRTIGPVEERPDQQFGLPEFLRLAEALGAEPIVTLADYHGEARDAADLVEYLNAPDDGRHPWAARRTADGRKAPWNVVWFECGNESEHGDHAGRVMTPAQYVERFRAFQAAMRAVDPRVKLGGVIATGFPDLEPWAEPVARALGPEMDFAIHHSYKPFYSGNDGKPDAATLFRNALACPDEIVEYLGRLRALLRRHAGRDVPLAITEFNGSWVQEKPVPYRHTLGNALLVAEMLRVFAEPHSGVAMAHFWEFANEYWGAVAGFPHKGETLALRPQFYPLAFLGDWEGSQVVATRVESPTFEAEGLPSIGVTRHAGPKRQRAAPIGAVPVPAAWSVTPLAGVEQTQEGDTLAVRFASDADLNYYHARKTVPAEPNALYRVTALVRTQDLASTHGACLQVGDARGWVATRSVAMSGGVSGTRDWTEVRADYHTLPDTREIEILARRMEGGGPARGRAWYRVLRVERMQPESFPAAPYVTAHASRSADGRIVRVILVNRRLDGPVGVTVRVVGMRAATARARSLEGERVDATLESGGVRVTERAVAAGAGGALALTLAPHSLTALEVRGR